MSADPVNPSDEAVQAALKFGPECVEEVTRAGQLEPCEKPSVAVRIDPNEGSPYAVCARHARAPMVSLAAVAAAVRAEALPDALVAARAELHRFAIGPATEALIDQQIDIIAAAVRAEAVADERRRIGRVLDICTDQDGNEYTHTHRRGEGEPECPACWAHDIRSALAAGPVPVATPEPTRCEGDECAQQFRGAPPAGWKLWPDNGAGCGDSWTCPECTAWWKAEQASQAVATPPAEPARERHPLGSGQRKPQRAAEPRMGPSTPSQPVTCIHGRLGSHLYTTGERYGGWCPGPVPVATP